MKNAKNRLNKEVNDLKSSQANTTLESATKKTLVIDDLEKSQYLMPSERSTAAA